VNYGRSQVITDNSNDEHLPTEERDHMSGTKGHVRFGSPITVVPKVQRCSKCNELKEAAEFYARPFTRTGLASVCRQCTAKAKAYKQARAQR
jgi:hypothetical protein